MLAASSYSAARRARVLRMELTDAGAPNVSPSVQTAAMTLIWPGRVLRPNSARGCEMLAPGSTGGWLSKIQCQTVFDSLACCEEEDTSKTRAHTGLPLSFGSGRAGPCSPVGWV